MSNVQNIKSVLTSIMVVALSEDISCQKNSDLLLSENHLRLVNDVIKGTLIEEIPSPPSMRKRAQKKLLIIQRMDGRNEEDLFWNRQKPLQRNVHLVPLNAFYNPQVAIKKLNFLSTFVDRHHAFPF